MISALAPPDRALTPRPGGKNIDGKTIDAQQTPTKRKGGFERAFKDVDGARQARAKTPKDTSPDQASEVVAVAGPAPARIIGGKSAKDDKADKADRRAGKPASRPVMAARDAGFSAGVVDQGQKADMAALKSRDVLAKSDIAKSGGKSDVEMLDGKKKTTTKQQRPTKTLVAANPQKVAVGDLVKPLADGKTDQTSDQDKSLSGGAPGGLQTKLADGATIGAITRVDTGQAVARAVAVQISQAAVNGADRVVEITLDPVELGKVKMKLHPSDAGITVQIIADRADTIDLMRRNSAMLEAEFRDAGYDNINFAFSQNNDGGHAQADDDPPSIEWLGEGRAGVSGSSASSAISSARTITGLGPSDGLDIRL